MDEEITEYQNNLQEMLIAEKEPVVQKKDWHRVLEEIKRNYKKPTCFSCGSVNLVTEYWTARKSPNVYRLYDKIICKDCQHIQIVEEREQDKNTVATLKVIREKYPLKDLMDDITPDDLIS